MPVYFVWRSIPVKLIADVNKVLHYSDINVVDRGKVEDDSFERRTFQVILRGTTATWTGVVPGTVLNTGQSYPQTNLVKIGNVPQASHSGLCWYDVSP